MKGAAQRYIPSMKVNMTTVMVAADIIVMKNRVQLQKTWSIE